MHLTNLLSGNTQLSQLNTIVLHIHLGSCVVGHTCLLAIVEIWDGSFPEGAAEGFDTSFTFTDSTSQYDANILSTIMPNKTSEI